MPPEHRGDVEWAFGSVYNVTLPGKFALPDDVDGLPLALAYCIELVQGLNGYFRKVGGS